MITDLEVPGRPNGWVEHDGEMWWAQKMSPLEWKLYPANAVPPELGGTEPTLAKSLLRRFLEWVLK